MAVSYTAFNVVLAFFFSGMDGGVTGTGLVEGS